MRGWLIGSSTACVWVGAQSPLVSSPLGDFVPPEGKGMPPPFLSAVVAGLLKELVVDMDILTSWRVLIVYWYLRVV